MYWHAYTIHGQGTMNCHHINIRVQHFSSHQSCYKFDIEDNKCDVTLNGRKVLDDVQCSGVKIPKKVCIAVVGAARDCDYDCR